MPPMYVADLGDTDAAEALALQAWDDMGGLDVLVNNAAIPKRRAVQVLTARRGARDDGGELRVAGAHDPRRAPAACSSATRA